MENFATEKNRYFRLGKSNYKNAITHFQWKSEEEDGVPNNLFGIQRQWKTISFQLNLWFCSSSHVYIRNNYLQL